MNRSRFLSIGATVATLLALHACGGKTPTAPTDCSRIGVSPVTVTLGSGASSATISVAAPAGCSWGAATTTGWLSVTSGSSGVGAGSVAIGALANTHGTARAGTVTVAQQAVQVAQDGASPSPSCAFDLRPSNRSIGSAGGGFTVQVLTGETCAWGFSSGAPWTQVVPDDDGAPNGLGNGTIGVIVAPNTDSAPRSGVVTIGTRALVVNQDGTSVPACTYNIVPASVGLNASGGQGSVTIQTGPTCSWWVEAETIGESWIRVGPVSRGSGPATITCTVSPNGAFTSRSGGLVVHGDSGNVRLVQQITQSAATCLYTVSPTEASFWRGGTDDGAGEGVAYADVHTQPGTCSWQATTAVPWIRFERNTDRGTGAGRIRYHVDGNYASSAPRTAEIVITGLSGVNPPARLLIKQAGGAMR